MQVDEPAVSWHPPSARATAEACCTDASHYELQVEIGNVLASQPYLLVREWKLRHTDYCIGLPFCLVTCGIKLDFSWVG